MADIKQAAQWLKEGKKIHISTCNFSPGDYFYRSLAGFVLYYDANYEGGANPEYVDMLGYQELLSEDWEIFDE